MRGYGGHRATQPEPGWTPPELIVAHGTAVRFIEEQTGVEKVYDFSDLPVTPAMRGWLVRVFARRLSPPAAIKRIISANPSYQILTRFARVLATALPPVADIDRITVEHLETFRDQSAGLRSQVAYVDILRGLLRDDPELSAEIRAAVVTLRPGPRRRSAHEELAPQRAPEYTDAEWQRITTVLRRDVRLARDRIREGKALLRRYRSSQLAGGSEEEEFAGMLDLFDRTGDIRRKPSGTPTNKVHHLGGVGHIGTQLTLAPLEMTSFALLLTALTGENFGTVAAWPAVTYRPDGGAPSTVPGVALIEASKPRRGVDREHMITPLEDLPASLAGVLSGDDDPRLFRSPLRVYELLLELTEVARRHGGHHGAFGAYVASPSRKGTYWVGRPQSYHVSSWAKKNGCPAERTSTADMPPINSRWIRNTALERRRRPVAQTRTTFNDHYLMRSDQVARESRGVVGDALRKEVSKARARQVVPVFTSAFVVRADADPTAAAWEAGLPAVAVSELVSGRSDTVLTGCTDHTDSPHAESGAPCPASFLACLECPNARALPHHLPVQVAAADRIAALRPNLDPEAWNASYATALGQLEEILGHYSPAERNQARTRVTTEQRCLVEDLLDGRWDLR